MIVTTTMEVPEVPAAHHTAHSLPAKALPIKKRAKSAADGAKQQKLSKNLLSSKTIVTDQHDTRHELIEAVNGQEEKKRIKLSSVSITEVDSSSSRKSLAVGVESQAVEDDEQKADSDG